MVRICSRTLSAKLGRFPRALADMSTERRTTRCFIVGSYVEIVSTKEHIGGSDSNEEDFTSNFRSSKLNAQVSMIFSRARRCCSYKSK